MCEKVSDYFYSIKIWVNILIKQHKQNDEIYRLYMVIGYVFEKISPLIYVKVRTISICLIIYELKRNHLLFLG